MFRDDQPKTQENSEKPARNTHASGCYSRRHTPFATIRLQAGSPPQLSQLIQARRLRFLDKWQGWIRHLTSPENSVSIRGLPKGWRRHPGRPRHTWLRTLEADLQPLKLGLNSAWKYSQDREHWKHLVDTATFQLGACS